MSTCRGMLRERLASTGTSRATSPWYWASRWHCQGRCPPGTHLGVAHTAWAAAAEILLQTGTGTTGTHIGHVTGCHCCPCHRPACLWPIPVTPGVNEALGLLLFPRQARILALNPCAAGSTWPSSPGMLQGKRSLLKLPPSHPHLLDELQVLS